MATQGIFRVECPHCGEGFDADFWTVVRGDRDHELKELILSGEFDLLVCPHCEDMFQHAEPFLYIDPPKDMLVFVMPASYEAEKDKWITKMRADYEPLKAGLSAAQGLASEPQFLFGLEPLTALLAADQDREEETEVMEFMAREEGMHLAPVKPAAARELDLTFTIPLPSGLKGRAAALKAASDLRAKNDALPRLKKLIDVLSAVKDENLTFLK